MTKAFINVYQLQNKWITPLKNSALAYLHVCAYEHRQANKFANKSYTDHLLMVYSSFVHD